MDYLDYPVPDETLIYAGDVPLQYNEQEGMYAEFIGIPACNAFLAASRDHEFLLNHKGNVSNILNSSIEPAK